MNIVNFLNGSEADYKNRNISDIINMTDNQLERVHDFIQLIFPLHERSAFSVSASVLTSEIVEEIKNDDDAIRNIHFIIDRFKKFYAIGDYDCDLVHKSWCNNYDHNLLRITRIIRSLRLLGLEKEAEDFYSLVSEVAGKRKIDSSTLSYWDKAVSDQVWETLRS